MKLTRASLAASTPTLVALYARVSSREQEKEGFSIPAQLKLLRTYAQEQGLAITQEIVDVETAKDPGRSGFTNLVALLAKRPGRRVVLCEKVDRLYRNLKDWVLLDEADAELHFVKENMVVAKDSKSADKFLHGIRVLMAKNCIENLSEEVRKGMTEKAASGHWPSNAPIGYRNVRHPDGKSVIEPDPRMGPIVTTLFETYATGEVSLDKLRTIALAEGLRFRRNTGSIARSTLHRILQNLVYTGDFTWDGVLYTGSHVPLVSRAVWEQVQTLLRRHNRKGGRKHEFAFAGLVVCGHCGGAMTGDLKKGKYRYYFCAGFKGKCPDRFVREEVLERRFVAFLDQLTFPDEVLALMADDLATFDQATQAQQTQAVKRLDADLAEITTKLDTLYDDRLAHRITPEFFDRKAAVWMAEQTRVQRALTESRELSPVRAVDATKLFELAKQASQLYVSQSPAEKRKLLKTVLSNSSWKSGQLDVSFRQPFDLLAATHVEVERAKAANAPESVILEKWLGSRDSNPDSQIQNLESYHWTTPQNQTGADSFR